MIRVYKLQYTDKDTAIADLKAKSVITEEGEYTTPSEETNHRTHAVVYLGNIQTGVDENEEPILSEYFHVDIMVDWEIDFGANEVVIAEGQPVAHSFA